MLLFFLWVIGTFRNEVKSILEELSLAYKDGFCRVYIETDSIIMLDIISKKSLAPW